MIKILNWDDGSGDKITLTYEANSKNQRIKISSEPNKSINLRQKGITFTTTIGGSISVQLILKQKPGELFVLVDKNNLNLLDKNFNQLLSIEDKIV